MTNKIQFEEEKVKKYIFKTQLNFIGGLIEFIKGFIAREIDL